MDTTTKRLLTAGVIAGPLFVAVALLQAFTREGFSLERHALSQLSLGRLGWIQIANFVLCGVLFLAFAVGVKRALRYGPGRTWAPILVAVFGVSLVIGGVFVADPAFGFPPGTPEGGLASEHWSWHGTIHAFAPVVGVNALIISFLVFARRFGALRQRGWMAASIVVAVAVLVLGSPLTMGDDPNQLSFLGLWTALVIGWSWISILATRIRAGKLDLPAPEPAAGT